MKKRINKKDLWFVPAEIIRNIYWFLNTHRMSAASGEELYLAGAHNARTKSNIVF